MEELLVLSAPKDNKAFSVLWDETKIKEFQRLHNLEKIRIRFASYSRTPIGFFKVLFAKITKRKIRMSGGWYIRPIHTIVLFYDAISFRVLSEVKEESAVEEIVQRIPKILAHTLAHEFGHAEEKTGLQLKLFFSWKLLIPFMGEKHIRQVKEQMVKSSEDCAEKFAGKHAKELENLIHIELTS